MALFCSCTWLGYGILINDLAVIVPNGLGVLFSIINLFTVFIFRNSTKEDIASVAECSYTSINKKTKEGLIDN
jgi:lipid-A-disaccharide synthase-like uncharacterized protein